MKTTLVIMAAGIGSRFGGGVKQLTAMGPGGEIIIDYSIHDALEAGFNKVVFIIRKDIEKDFKEIIGDRIAKITEVEYAYQDVHDLPEGYTCPEGRKKPWGTGQAILCAKNIVKEPFAVINADDYYGKKGFQALHKYLTEGSAYLTDGKMNMTMAGFILGNTLSDNGGVTRGLCQVDGDNHLTDIVETKNIVKTPDGAATETADGLKAVDAKGFVSMNMWGFYPEIFEVFEKGFPIFLDNLGEEGTSAEYLLPSIVDDMLKGGEAVVTVLPTDDRWFGVTYAADKQAVKDAFAALIENGIYKTPLFD